MLQMTVSVLGFLVGLVVWGFLLVFHLSVLQLILLIWVSSSSDVPWTPLALVMPPSTVHFQCGHKTLLSCDLLKLNLAPLGLDFEQKVQRKDLF